MDIPLYLLEAVVFIEIIKGDYYEQIGTGFLISHRNNVDFIHTYFITCRHVIRDYLIDDIQMYARVNLRDELGVEHIPLSNKWIYHDDDEIDLAVLTVEKVEGMDRPTIMGSMSSNLIYGREGLRINFQKDLQVGYDVVFIGLFQHYPGHERNHPLVRTGRIALVTKEKLPGVRVWLGTSDYFLVECQAYPGMSGSPVFAVKEHEGSEGYYLIGVMAGYYTEDEKIIEKFTHYGISLVVPIEKLGDIIWSDKLEKEREKKAKAELMKKR